MKQKQKNIKYSLIWSGCLLLSLLLFSCSSVQDEDFDIGNTSTDVTASDKIPLLVEANAVEDAIVVSWAPPVISEGTLNGYKIYSTDDDTDEYSLLVSLKIKDLLKKDGRYRYTDTPAKKNTLYYYKLTSSLTDGSESELSETVSAEVLDDTIPEAPTALTATVNDSEIDLAWEAPDEEDLDGYNVYFKAPALDQDDFVKLTSTPLEKDAVSYTHENPEDTITYTYVVTALDIVGNESNHSDQVSAATDESGPSLSFTTKPASSINTSSTTFTISSDEDLSSCTYTVNSGTEKPCGSSLSFTISDLEEGSYTIEVKATDENENSSTLSLAWKVDLTIPTVSIDSTPDEITNEDTATFVVSSNDSTGTLSYILDGAEAVNFGSPLTLEDLSDGDHEITVTVTDLAGNEVSASYEWTIDTTPPNIDVSVNGPNLFSKKYTAEVFFSSDEANVSFTYVYNGQAKESAEGSQIDLYSFEGPNSITVTATDTLGNANSVTKTWELNSFLFNIGEDPEDETFSFSQPRSIFEDTQENIIVVDSTRHRVQVFDANRDYKFTIGQTDKAGNTKFENESINSFLRDPADAVADSDGNIYISDSLQHRIQKFDAAGEYVDTFGKSEVPGDNLSEFDNPMGLGIDEDSNRLYIADLNNARVKVHTLTGTYVTSIESAGNDTLLKPIDVAIDKNGNIYVVDQGRHAVFIYNSAGEFTDSLGTKNNFGTSLAHFHSPTAIFVNDDLDIFVSDTSNDRVMVFDKDLDFKYMIGLTNVSGDTNYYLNSPQGVFHNSNGKLFIADRANNRVMVYNR